MTPQTRLWQHDNLWRIQSLRQLPDRHGVLQDVWESWREHGKVLFFETEEQAREYMESAAKKQVWKIAMDEDAHAASPLSLAVG